MANYIRGIAASARCHPLTRAIRQLRKSKLELTFFALILATILAVQFERQILGRTITVGPDTKLSSSHAHSDVAAGGTSSATADPARPYTWACELRAAYAYPYCAYEWVFDDGGKGTGFDLTRFDRLAVSLTYKGKAKSLRLYLKNFDPRYSKPGVTNPYKINASEIPLSVGEQTIRIETSDFSVAEWWIIQHRIPPGLSHPQFDNIVAMEVSTGTGAPLGVHHFQVHQITLHGRFLNTREWYLVLSAGWLALMSFFLIRLRREIRARREAEKQAERHARHDPVTGFLNRRTFETQLDRELASTERDQPRALLLLGIEHLTSAGDLYGQAASEALLAELASRIRIVLGSEALVGRIRDDEFACFMQGDAELVGEKANELLQKLNGPVQRHGDSINAAATIGIACFPHHGSTYATLLASANIALREGQRSGRLTHRFFDPELATAVSHEAEKPAADRLPKFLVAAALEILIKESRRIATTWLGGSAVVVQLSIDQLQDEWAADRLITIIKCGGLEASDLVVKVKESCFTCAAAVRNLQTLQQAGIRIILADFKNVSAGRCSSIRFDYIELSDDYLNSQLAAARSLHKRMAPSNLPASASVVSKAS